MSLSQTLMHGLVGAAIVFASRATGVGTSITASSDANVSMRQTLPIPGIMPSNGYGLEWVLIPAVGAYLLSR